MASKEKEELEEIILNLLDRRNPGKTICPSETARAYDPERWREWMDDVRNVAQLMQKEGKLLVIQRGKSVDPNLVKGPVRLKLPKQPGSYR